MWVSAPALLPRLRLGVGVGSGPGPGLTSESADAARGCLDNDLSAGPRPLAPVGAAGLICLAWARGQGFTGPGGQRVRAIPQPEKGMTVTIVETPACTRAHHRRRGHPRGRARRGGARPDRRAARRAGVPGQPGWLCPAAGLAWRVRHSVPGRGRRDWQLRRRAGPAYHRGWCAGGGGPAGRTGRTGGGRANRTLSMRSALPAPPSLAAPGVPQRAGMARWRRSGR